MATTEPALIVRDPWIAITCPVCRAPSGQRCRATVGLLHEPHAARRQLAAEFAARMEDEQRRFRSGCDD
jgi:hypothetical protein